MGCWSMAVLDKVNYPLLHHSMTPILQKRFGSGQCSYKRIIEFAIGGV
jgi:hypothetical protein